jgi:glycosyltransferase involved in cell wall biosynthesis
MTETSVIGVIVPVYNGEQYIEAALNSLLREKGLSLDIIVIDDGSTDRTIEIVSRIMTANSSVRLLPGSHAGVSKARNLGLSAVHPTTDYITFLDSDDLNPPGRIARQLNKLKEHPEQECIVGLVEFFETADENEGRPLPGSKTMAIRGIQLAAALFSKSVFDRIGSFDEEMQQGEDTDFFLRLLESQTNYILEDEVAVFYRRHPHNMTNNLLEARRGFMDAIRRSLVRRRETGVVVELGEMFKNRNAAEGIFRNG